MALHTSANFEVPNAFRQVIFSVPTLCGHVILIFHLRYIPSVTCAIYPALFSFFGFLVFNLVTSTGRTEKQTETDVIRIP